jgi:pimeloyl-ACP methyl ester carboxylesterase
VRRLLVTSLLLLAVDGHAADGLWQPHVLRSYDGREAQGELALLPVRENRRAPDSRWIRIAVIRLPSTRAAAGGSPILFLSGGPGIPASALARVPVYFTLFNRLREAGDVLLLDQRGSGMSVPNLVCPPHEIPNDFASSDDRMREALLTRVSDCSNHWRALGVDLHGYTTREIADDVDTVRRAVAADRLELLAFSYGSEVAFEILRRRPATVARVVFAGARGPDTLLKMPAEWDRVLETVGLLSRVGEAARKLDQMPVSVETKKGAVLLGGIAVLSVVRADLPDVRALVKMPALLDEVASGRHDALAARVERMRDSLQDSFNLMTLAVDCASGWSPRRLDAAERQSRAATMRNVNLQWRPEICRAIHGSTATPTAMSSSSAPALFVTGTLDANTPVAQAEQFRRSFHTSVHVIVQNGGHETLPIDRVQERILRFLSGQPVSSETIVEPLPSFAAH